MLSFMELKAVAAYSLTESDLLPLEVVVRKSIIKNPKGTDLSIPNRYIPALSKLMDKKGFPMYYVCEDCVSVAATYTLLFEHERAR